MSQEQSLPLSPSIGVEAKSTPVVLEQGTTFDQWYEFLWFGWAAFMERTERFRQVMNAFFATMFLAGLAYGFIAFSAIPTTASHFVAGPATTTASSGTAPYSSYGS